MMEIGADVFFINVDKRTGFIFLFSYLFLLLLESSGGQKINFLIRCFPWWPKHELVIWQQSKAGRLLFSSS